LHASGSWSVSIPGFDGAAFGIFDSFFDTSSGFLGTAPPNLHPGDFVCLVDQCSFPVILHKVNSHYLHIGPCFVLGLMNGEAAKMVKKGEIEVQEFKIH